MAVAEVEFSPWNSNPSLKKHALSAVEGRGRGDFQESRNSKNLWVPAFTGITAGRMLIYFANFSSATLIPFFGPAWFFDAGTSLDPTLVTDR
jgi:hypothetical protein